MRWLHNANIFLNHSCHKITMSILALLHPTYFTLPPLPRFRFQPLNLIFHRLHHLRPTCYHSTRRYRHARTYSTRHLRTLTRLPTHVLDFACAGGLLTLATRWPRRTRRARSRTGSFIHEFMFPVLEIRVIQRCFTAHALSLGFLSRWCVQGTRIPQYTGIYICHGLSCGVRIGQGPGSRASGFALDTVFGVGPVERELCEVFGGYGAADCEDAGPPGDVIALS